MKRDPDWTRWSDDQILDLRMKDLGLTIRSSWLQPCFDELTRELHRRRLVFRPHIWLSHDWFSPEGVPGMAVPFYLANARLMRLERSQMLEVEGGSRDECIKIMRHECGHALQHGYQLQRNRRWQRIFGKASQKYPETYRPNPASRRYVQHLRLYYAQSHPVEDFAETFAVWLLPKSHWRKRYAGWSALEKLDFVDELMQELGPRRPPVRTQRRADPIDTMTMTLREYYERKRAQYSRSYPDIYDRDLRRLFSDDPADASQEMASAFLRRNRAEIRRLVARWTGEYQFTLEQVLEDMIGRSRELKLRAVGGESTLVVEFAILLTVKTMNFHYTRRAWFAL